MIDNEIIKALECCGIETNCKDCPYHDVSCCQDELCKAALNLINCMQEDYNRLQKSYVKEQELFSEQCLENERLKVNIDKLQETIFKKEDLMQMLYSNNQAYYDELVFAKDEIERLKEENENLKINNLKEIRAINENLINQLRLHKSEVRKEFAEKVKEVDGNSFLKEGYDGADEFLWFDNESYETYIDDLLKEMEKEND